MDIPNPEELKNELIALHLKALGILRENVSKALASNLRLHFSEGCFYCNDFYAKEIQFVLEEYTKAGWKFDMHKSEHEPMRILFWPNGSKDGNPACWEKVQYERKMFFSMGMK